MPIVGSEACSSKRRRRLTMDILFRLITQTNGDDAGDNQSALSHENEQINQQTNGNSINGYVLENDLRHLWYLLSQMIRKRLLKHEPCLLPELGAFVIIDHPSSDNSTNPTKEPFFVLDTTFARRHRLSRIKNPNLASALSLSLQASRNSTHVAPNSTLSSFNMQTLDYVSLQNESGLTREQLMMAISQIFGIIDKEIRPHNYCDLEFPELGRFRVLFGLAVFDFSDLFLQEFNLTLRTTSTSSD